jgi:hypothetical protein
MILTLDEVKVLEDAREAAEQPNETMMAIKETLAAIVQIKKALGAPGDYGYETKEGKALIRLYQAHGKLLKIVPEEERN